MAQNFKNDSPTVADCLAGTPGERLDLVREFFRCRGLFGQSLELKCEEQTYRLICDERAMAVFRVNRNQVLPPGNPGWMVCRLDNDSLFEECAEPGLAECRLSCPNSLQDWLELVDKNFC
jgi:hypothetical protein